MLCININFIYCIRNYIEERLIYSVGVQFSVTTKKIVTMVKLSCFPTIRFLLVSQQNMVGYLADYLHPVGSVAHLSQHFFPPI